MTRLNIRIFISWIVRVLWTYAFAARWIFLFLGRHSSEEISWYLTLQNKYRVVFSRLFLIIVCRMTCTCGERRKTNEQQIHIKLADVILLVFKIIHALYRSKGRRRGKTVFKYQLYSIFSSLRFESWKFEKKKKTLRERVILQFVILNTRSRTNE